MAKRILYIEDNPNDQRLVKKVLGTRGYDIVVAEDGQRGLELAKQIQPDLILVDLQMPGLDGLATTRCLRQIPSCAATPIVALTAHAERYSRQLYLDAGCTDYEQKQAGIKPIIALVQRYLSEGSPDGG